jgi:hypothetical protein
MGTKWRQRLEAAEGNSYRLTRPDPPGSAEGNLDEDLSELYGQRAAALDHRPGLGYPRETVGGPAGLENWVSADGAGPLDPANQPLPWIQPLPPPIDGSSANGAAVSGPPQEQQAEFDFGSFFGTFDDDLDALLMSFAPTQADGRPTGVP